MHTFTLLFLLALAGSALLRLWLAARQLAHVQKHRDTVPESFAQRIPIGDHHKAADYTVTNTRIGMLELVYDGLLLLGWTYMEPGRSWHAVNRNRRDPQRLRHYGPAGNAL